MSAYWFLAAFAATCIFNVRCDHLPAGGAGTSGDTLARFDMVYGFKPCMDENCEYGPSELEPKPVYEGQKENPKVHCIMLRPSAVKTFSEIENTHPGISDIKYKVLEELIGHMCAFSSLKMENCQPDMKLIELVILAANSLKAEYMHHGGEDCIYTSFKNETEQLYPNDKVTEGPYVPTSKPTEKHVHSSTEYPATEKPYLPSSTMHPHTHEPPRAPCPDGVTMEEPCKPHVDTITEEYSSEEIEIIAEDESEVNIPQVGSMKGIPGVHYPNYTDIPITSFTCSDKKYVPGFYADPETRCQVFHVCYEHRRESFLCPVGTIFNQPILACDYWYSSDCSVACDYYDVNEKTELKEEKIDEEVEEILNVIAESEISEEHDSKSSHMESDLDTISSFFPVKAIVTDVDYEVEVPIHTPPKTEEIASEIVDKMATTATKVISVTRDIVKSIPEPLQPVFKPVVPVKHIAEHVLLPDFEKPLKMKDLLKQTAIPLAKPKIAVSKVTAFKTVVPVAAKTKVVLPVAFAKAKLATKAAAIPAIKIAAAAPIAKAKFAATVPIAKAAVTVPFLTKAKLSAGVVPVAKVAIAAPVLAKTKMAAVPVAKLSVAAPIVAKGKVAVPAVKMAAATVAAKSSIPALKAKMFASVVPLAKAKVVPLAKGKVVKSASTPLLKAKVLALPLAKSKLAGPLPIAKVKLAKAAAISPLTKKALALGYMKLLKAKKFALMG